MACCGILSSYRKSKGLESEGSGGEEEEAERVAATAKARRKDEDDAEDVDAPCNVDNVLNCAQPLECVIEITTTTQFR